MTLNTRFVNDWILQQVGMDSNLLAKKPGQSFPEIDADSLSANKQEKATIVWCGLACPFLTLQLYQRKVIVQTLHV